MASLPTNLMATQQGAKKSEGTRLANNGKKPTHEGESIVWQFQYLMLIYSCFADVHITSTVTENMVNVVHLLVQGIDQNLTSMIWGCRATLAIWYKRSV
jgi:hypothetical protein